MTSARLAIKVRRDRFGWRHGYFSPMLGARIPFLGRGREGMVGRLMSIDETAEMIGLVFEDVEVESADDDGGSTD